MVIEKRRLEEGLVKRQQLGDKLLCKGCGKTFFCGYPGFQWNVSLNCPFCKCNRYDNVSAKVRGGGKDDR